MTSRIAELNNYVSRYRQRAQAAQDQRYGRGQRLAESNAAAFTTGVKDGKEINLNQQAIA